MSMIGNFQLAAGQAAYGGGTATSGPVAVVVGLGFVPVYVKVICLDTSPIVTEFINGNADVDTKQGVKISKPSAVDIAAMTSNGITVGDVTVSGQTIKGFTIGTSCLAASKTYSWIALG